MSSKKYFEKVYRVVEAIYGRSCSQLDIDRAYARYLKVEDEEPRP